MCISNGVWPNFDQINISHRPPCSVWMVSLLTWQNDPEGGYDEKSWEMACNWLMMTSFAERHPRRFGYNYRQKKTRPQCGLNRALKLTVTHCPTALLLLFLSLCERPAHETWHSYRRHLLLHNNRLLLRETWLPPFSIWRCYVTKGWYWEKRQ